MKEEKKFKKKAHAIKNPHERCTFLVKEFISLSSTANNRAREKTIKKMLMSLAGSNCPEAFLYLGKLFYLPNNKYGKAFIAFKNSIKNRYPLAYYEFGYMLENGLGCRKSTEKAVGCYIKAAGCGSIDAMYRLGTAYLYKELGLDNITKGIKYLDKATVLGHGEAAYKLSNIYETGIKGFLNANQESALHYLQESADLLYTPALDKLGWCYENGRMGNFKDNDKAFYYYLKASNNGYSQSMYSLAGLIMNNTEIDDRLAYEWMLKATRVADPLNKAFYGMGVFYEYGVGVARNLKVALDWYKKARDNNVPDAEQKIKDLEYKINVISNNYGLPSSDIKTNSNINSMENNVNSNMNSYSTQDNRTSLSVTNRESDYYYSPIIMPSPAISVKKKMDKNIIVTKEQLKDMNLTINPEGKIVPLDPSKPSHPFQNYRLSTSTVQHTFSNSSSNFDSVILVPNVEDNINSEFSNNNNNNIKRLSNISNNNNNNNMKRLSNISNNNDNNLKRLSNISNNNNNNNEKLKRLSNTSNIITKISSNNVAVQVIEDENKEYTIVPPKRTCYPVISPLINSDSVKTNTNEAIGNMEPASKTEVELTKLSVNVSNKVNVDMGSSKTNGGYCRPKIYKIDSQGNIESIPGVNSPTLDSDNINTYNTNDNNNYDTLNIPDNDNLYSNNELPVPKRFSSFGNVDINAISQLNTDITKDENIKNDKENTIDNNKENNEKEDIVDHENENIVENIVNHENENVVENIINHENENVVENIVNHEKENIIENIIGHEKESIVDNNDDTINNDTMNNDTMNNDTINNDTINNDTINNENNNVDIIKYNDEIENHDETINYDNNNDDEDDDDDDNDSDNENDNENENDNYGNNENGSLLNVDTNNDDPLADVSFDFSYDPAKLNNDNVDIIDDPTKANIIKGSKSIKTYLPLPRRLESHDNPITNGFLDTENINPNSTVSSTAFVDSFKNLSEQQKNESNRVRYLSREDSQRVFQQEVKLSDEERNNNSNNWMDRHPTILSITTDSSEFIFSKLRENSQNSIQSNEYPLSKFRQNSQGSTNSGTMHRFSDISNSATVNYPIHKYGSENSVRQYSSNISSPLIQSSFTPFTPITKEDPHYQKHQANIKSQLSQSPVSSPIAIPAETSEPPPNHPPVPPPRRPLDGYYEDINDK